MGCASSTQATNPPTRAAGMYPGQQQQQQQPYGSRPMPAQPGYPPQGGQQQYPQQQQQQHPHYTHQQQQYQQSHPSQPYQPQPYGQPQPYSQQPQQQQPYGQQPQQYQQQQYYPPQQYPPQQYQQQQYEQQQQQAPPPYNAQGGSSSSNWDATKPNQGGGGGYGGPPPAYTPAPFQYGQQAAREKEPMLLLDRTGSMNWPTNPTNNTPRKDTVREAIQTVVSTLAQHDSQAGHEAAGQEDEGGGLRTVTFAGKTAADIGDLNPGNLRQKWNEIQFAGTTWIVPGWRELKAVYNEEFGNRPMAERPLLLALVITDGEAEDTAEFASMLAQESDGMVWVTLAIVGTGDEYARALHLYQSIAQQHRNVRVIPFSGETDPNLIAQACLAALE